MMMLNPMLNEPLTPDQLSSIAISCSSNIMHSFTPTGVSSHHVITPSTIAPAYYNNAKYEEKCCQDIKLPDDGSKEELMPFLILDIKTRDGHQPHVNIRKKTYDLTCSCN
jgi:hypothetical protein